MIKAIIPLHAVMALVLVCVHLFAGRLRFLRVIPRSRWLSAAGGISVAYVFVLLFPELEQAQGHFDESTAMLPWLEHHAYLVALAGLVLFYGLERAVKTTLSQRDTGEVPEEGRPAGHGIFWLHMTTFSVYNALIGYLLVHREEDTARSLLVYSAAMAVHFLVNDFGLRQDHRIFYDRWGRLALSASVLGGYLLGLLMEIDETAKQLLFAFLAGGVILNVLKEELPEERKSHFSSFLLGALGYSILLLL